MFIKITDRINWQCETEIPGRIDEVMAELKNNARKRGSVDSFLPGQVDYREFRFFDNEVEIQRMPGMFTPFRAFGKIRLTFFRTSMEKTTVKCTVLPGNGWIPYFSIFLFLAMAAWSASWIALGWRFDPLTQFGVPIGVCILFTGFFFIRAWHDRRSLIDYARRIIGSISK